MQGWHFGKGLIYYRPIFRLTKLAFLKFSFDFFVSFFPFVRDRHSRENADAVRIILGDLFFMILINILFD